MLERVNKFLKEKEFLTEDLKIWVQDKSIPLELRWNTFMESDLGDHYSYLLRLKSYSLDPFYENCYKYEFIQVYEILERICEDLYDKMLSDEENAIIFINKTIDIKEEILSLFVKSFEYNW